MPSKNTIKIYVKNAVYHVYNRGIDKRIIFCDEQDYKIFLYYLKVFLTPTDYLKKDLPGIKKRLGRNYDLYKRICLFAYVLMPNHFHLMLKQKDEKAMIELMRRLTNAYVEYFNKKYKRVGPLFQGRYKAVLIDKESYFLHLSRYIHQNPLELLKKLKLSKLEDYPYSSYPDYLGKRRHTLWLCIDEIMDYFKNATTNDIKGFSSYREFIENYPTDSDEEILGDLRLEP